MNLTPDIIARPPEPSLVTEDERVELVATPSQLARVVERASRATMVALDVEGDGLFAYRAKLCTMQLGWRDASQVMHIALVDTLACGPAPLAELLGDAGPPKVLHDFTFDAKLLQQEHVLLGNVRDTSVLARLLGRKATGLGSLLASELGVQVSKDLQQHDWSRRPLTDPQRSYLAADVRHLIALYDKLSTEAREKAIEEEVDEESRFKLEAALAPPRERGPSYLRIKGSDKLDPLALAVLRRLVDTRERLAADWDVPPFKVAGNDLLLDLSRGRPTDREGLRGFRRGFSSRLSGASDRLLAAIAEGIADGTVPPEDRAEPPRLDRAIASERRAREKRLTAFRRAEALRRGVDEQVVLPGHCLQELVALDAPTLSAIGSVKGLGAKRLELYGDGLLRAMLAESPSAPAPSGDERAP